MSNDLRAVVTADIRQFVSSMNAVGLSANAAASASVTAFLAITAAVVGLDKAGINAAKSYEELSLALKFATGNARLANEEFATLVKFADETPFDTSDLIKYAVQLRNVTDNAFGTAEQIKNMAGALAAAQTLGRKTELVNSIGRIISAFQVGSGAIGRYTRTLRNSTKFSSEAAKQLKFLAKNGGTAEQAIEMLNKEFSKTKGNVKELARSTKGLESTLRSVSELTLAQLGSGGQSEYNELLQVTIDKLRELRDTDAFSELGNSLGRFNQILADTADSSSLEGILVIVRSITDAITVLIGAVQLLNEATPSLNFGSIKGFINNFRPNDKAFDTTTEKVASEGLEVLRELKVISSYDARVANTMDPEKTAETK